MSDKEFKQIAAEIMDSMDIDSIFDTLHSLLVRDLEKMADEELNEYLSHWGISK